MFSVVGSPFCCYTSRNEVVEGYTGFTMSKTSIKQQNDESTTENINKTTEW
jgi:hypothetical protein